MASRELDRLIKEGERRARDTAQKLAQSGADVARSAADELDRNSVVDRARDAWRNNPVGVVLAASATLFLVWRLTKRLRHQGS